jgi:predicted SnoaL-like aldol condensation-catalyzing enzyme
MKIGVAIVAALALAFLSAPADAASKREMERNKKNVIAFYDAALNKKDFEAAKKYFGAGYKQHNPSAADGPEGLKGFIAFLKDKFPNNKSEFKRVFADGDYVIVHVRARARNARLCDHRHFPTRPEGRDRRALGRGTARPGKGRQRKRNVLSGKYER